MVELKVVENPLLYIVSHFFIIVLGFVKDPLKIRDSFSLRNLAPPVSLLENLPNQLLIIISP